MQMRPEVQIAAMIKAMKDVVIPAVAGSNKLAEEQAKLVVGMLGLMARQLPVQFRFDRDELGRLVETSAALRAVQAREPSARAACGTLVERAAEAELVLDECRRDPDDLRRSIHTLRAAICDVVDAFAQGGAEEQLKVERIVLAMSAEQLLRDRSLVKLQGWEPDPAAVPEIESLIG